MFVFFQSQSNYKNSQQATQQSPQSSNQLSQQQVQPSFPISQHISQQHEQPNENDDVIEIQSQEKLKTLLLQKWHNIKVSMECCAIFEGVFSIFLVIGFQLHRRFR